MPSRSQSATPESRAGNPAAPTSDQSTKSCSQKAKPGGPVRRKTSFSKLGSSSQPLRASRAAAPAMSVGFRIASVPPPHGKVARKESGGQHAAPTRTTPKASSGGSGGGSETRIDNGKGNGFFSKQNLTVTAAQPTKLCPRPKSRAKSVIYKSFGPSSQSLTEEKRNLTLPDPYLEMTVMADEELRLREHAEMLARTRVSLTGQALAGSVAKGAASSCQTPQPPSPGAASATPSPAQTPTGSGREGASAPDSPAPAVDCKSPGCSSGLSSANGDSRGRGNFARASSSSRRPASHISEDGDNGSESGGGGGGGSGSGGCRGASSNRRAPAGESAVPPSSKEKGVKQMKTQDSSPPEQDDEDDEEDETGMPQAVRLPEAAVPGESETNQEIIKRLHRNRMETIAREVEPSQLMQHLAQGGYFRYDYSGHARTTTDNHNLKSGHKKGVERLYLWLSMYSPPSSQENAAPKS